MITIENKELRASFLTKGAEWRSFVDKKTGGEFLWQADPAFWGKSAPLLFPIVGGLTGGKYEHAGKTYSLGRHGFARDREFEVKVQQADRVVFLLKSNAETREVYPFDWELEVEYSLSGRSLKTAFVVRNLGKDSLWFSLGAHPAFRVPFPGSESEKFEDYSLEWEKAETLERWLLSAEGIQNGQRRPVETQGKLLNLNRPLFTEDALIFKTLVSRRVTLRSAFSPTKLAMDFEGFPYFGVWDAPGSPFLCLEPWCGVADKAGASGKLSEKEGIESLKPDQDFKRSFSVSLEG